MKKKDVEINELYLVKVSGKKVPVKLIYAHPYGGWIGRNMVTGRKVRIKTAARLRFKLTKDSADNMIKVATPFLNQNEKKFA